MLLLPMIFIPTPALAIDFKLPADYQDFGRVELPKIAYVSNLHFVVHLTEIIVQGPGFLDTPM